MTNIESDEKNKGGDDDMEILGACPIKNNLNKWKFDHLCITLELSQIYSPPLSFNYFNPSYKNICSNFLSLQPICSSALPKYQPKILLILGCILRAAICSRIGLGYSTYILLPWTARYPSLINIWWGAHTAYVNADLQYTYLMWQ